VVKCNEKKGNFYINCEKKFPVVNVESKRPPHECEMRRIWARLFLPLGRFPNRSEPDWVVPVLGAFIEFGKVMMIAIGIASRYLNRKQVLLLNSNND
jgi:hypothetical protein